MAELEQINQGNVLPKLEKIVVTDSMYIGDENLNNEVLTRDEVQALIPAGALATVDIMNFWKYHPEFNYQAIVWNTTLTQRQFHEAIKDIKLYGWEQGFIYKIWLIAYEHDPNQDRIIIATSDDNGATWTSWLDSELRTESKVPGEFTTVTIENNVDKTRKAILVIDYDSLVSGTIYYPWAATSWDPTADTGDNFPGLIIDKETYKTTDGFIISWHGEELSLVSYYADGTIEYRFLNFGNNNLFDLGYIIKTDSLGATTSFLTPVTDHFTAYQVLAVNNINGDLGSSDDNTGGNHAYNTTGTVTATEVSVDIFVNNLQVSEFVGAADNIEIRIKNRVQAFNTILVGGGGREVLEELNVIKIHKDGSIKMDVTRSVTALEDITINRMFLHSYSILNYDNFRFVSGTQFDEKAPSASEIYPTAEEKSVLIYNTDGDNVLMRIEDLGLTSNRRSATKTDLTYQYVNKLYQACVQQSEALSLVGNDQVQMYGGFEFYSD